jgi:uncharacterized membrane protein YraQ (UPF0718 family)
MMKNTFKLIKNNIFFVLVVMAYLVLMIFHSQTGLQGIYNSGYYMKEMLMIMPAIFILTALLDSWVPKETIIKTLGKEAKTKGIIFSFLLGSISAGPIYAAFPLCVMLHKKGATIKNIVIILSSWAVVKIPMLINEAKFLGLTFMVVRWILTVISIMIFAWIMGKIVKDSDLPQEELEVSAGVIVNRNACMGCTVCTKNYPEVFEMKGKKASVKDYLNLDMELLKNTIEACPVKAIDYN